MSITITSFDKKTSEYTVHKITLTNQNGTFASILDYGATLQSFIYDGVDVLLGYDTVSGYANANGSYIGACIGRFGNRIGGGRFELNGQTIQLNCNEAARGCHLHGGNIGFDKKMWAFTTNETANAVTFSLVSPDGEENYPGTLTVNVTYTLTDDDTLQIAYNATSDKDTIINMTNHAYFNPNGFDGASTLNNTLWIAADEVTEVDNCLIPTGRFLSLDNSPLDFRKGKIIGDAVKALDDTWAAGGGIDHNFVLSREHTGNMVTAVQVTSPDTGIRIVCRTTEPAVQIYGGHALQENDGKNGLKWGHFQGFCMETQHYPDSVNNPHFPSVVLRAGDEYKTTTEYHIDKNPIEA